MESHMIMFIRAWYWKEHENTCFNLVDVDYFECVFDPQKIHNLKKKLEKYVPYCVKEGKVAFSWHNWMCY